MLTVRSVSSSSSPFCERELAVQFTVNCATGFEGQVG